MSVVLFIKSESSSMDGEWSYKNSGSRKFLISQVSQSRFFSGYARLAGSIFMRRCLVVSIFNEAVSQSRFLYENISHSRYLYEDVS